MANIKGVIAKIKSQYESATSNPNTTQYWNLSSAFDELEGGLREYMQATTKDQINQIINRLEAGHSLSAEDLELIRLWLVGDADYYLKMENNYNDWLLELKRLIGEFERIDEENLGITQASKLRAEALDGIRVLGDIVFLLKQQERVKNFESSVKDIDSKERKLIIDLLRGKIRSPRE
ncbi:MAG: hypothetical protein A2Y03_07745 [Omnitrophica WOR_2 bacterium GWF2_38_59]|nr:MAG: hypothetical protein A2Y06_01750 [Omnitrophica WOR_2 bacterium GWA2_37_7]OGX26797.1 MAG: hypothetical protein A2Y03_07745 [Omnitrophica WOR_2 bacterium GWF2_38_59]OGX49461.1 MAG: hypothetical protein A2243_09620 [Omnitrophica WOR_2 bacterium RIFOXYA2_FULL_38_17]OGX54771.1 MAG: hypothetical protein A2267_06585 [Omnitrophica WOR_2 bacterium RIFOXYA12_FULL_38_10]OGX57799.1 MAG: hypothetical protein A2447_06880 [Omnitrophica WOR_2 bacterium RIFOXYC2_FULL_38_12]OGX58565.1 MAG: hypothetical 